MKHRLYNRNCSKVYVAILKTDTCNVGGSWCSVCCLYTVLMPKVASHADVFIVITGFMGVATKCVIFVTNADAIFIKSTYSVPPVTVCSGYMNGTAYHI